MERFTDGGHRDRDLATVWRQAGLIQSAPRLKPPKPAPAPLTWDHVLDISCPLLFAVRLNIGAGGCPIQARRRIYVRRTYIVLNSASLTLLDGTPLPCTSMTVKTDANSWC